MPSVSDVIQTNIITELNGVQMSSVLYWEVDGLGDDDPVLTNLTKLATAYAAVVQDITTTTWAVSCITYFNMTSTEPKVVLPVTIAGLDATDSHPQSQVIRVNRWGLHIPDGKIRSGAHYLSGIPEAFSTVGRVNDIVEFAGLENFLSDTLILSDDGWTLTPQLLITPDSVGAPTVKAFVLCTEAQTNPTFTVLRSRKTRLCGTA
jgi:hypothetical protein